MKRVFEVQISASRYPGSVHTCNAIAENAEEAIRKAKASFRRSNYQWRGGWLVHSLVHKGPAV